MTHLRSSQPFPTSQRSSFQRPVHTSSSSYVIFYGPSSAWSPVTTQVSSLVSIVTTLLANIGGSPYFQINQGNMGTNANATAGYYYQSSSYNGGNKAYPPNAAGNPAFGGYMFDGTYTPGKSLADSDLQVGCQLLSRQSALWTLLFRSSTGGVKARSGRCSC